MSYFTGVKPETTDTVRTLFSEEEERRLGNFRKALNNEDLPLSVTNAYSADAILAQLIDLKPANAAGAYAFKWDYLIKEVLSKLNRPHLYSEEYKRDRAIQVVRESEQVMLGINRRRFLAEGANPQVNSVLFCTQRILSSMFQGFNTHEWLSKGSFSNGATVTRSYDFGDPMYKYGCEIYGKPSLKVAKRSVQVRYPKPNLDDSESLYQDHYRYEKPLSVGPRAYKYYAALSSVVGTLPKTYINHTGNRITTVSKKTDINRAIAKENDWDVYFQRGIGKGFRHVLGRQGINLNTQDNNRNLARFGARTGRVATIDVKNSSNSVAYRTIMDLFPYHIFDVLDSLRAPRGTVIGTGEVFEWQMFSSMGNGYTFELQSILYYALCSAVCEELGISVVDHESPTGRLISVFGDDIILPTEAAPLLIATLSHIGLVVNDDKTFISGPFRESCGGHYYGDHDVSPFYIKEEVKNVADLNRILNRIREWAYDELHDICDETVYPLWRALYKRHPLRDDLRGGLDVERVDYIVSPGRSTGKLIRQVRRTQLGGPFALMRLAQDNKDSYVDNYLVSRQVLDRELSSLSVLDLIHTTNKFAIVANVGDSSLRSYRFSNEM